MTSMQWEEQLKNDGYSQVATHTDPAGYAYSEHDHPVDTAYVVLEGDMVVVVEGQSHTVGVGERLDIKKKVLHSAQSGTRGCKFLIGVRM